MDISSSMQNDIGIVTVAGKMDAQGAGVFSDILKDMAREGTIFVLLDFSRLEFISSSGLLVILSIAKQLGEKGGRLVFSGVKGPVEDVFKISRFDSMFQLFNTQEDAIASLK